MINIPLNKLKQIAKNRSLLLYCYHCADIIGIVYHLLFIAIIVRS